MTALDHGAIRTALAAAAATITLPGTGGKLRSSRTPVRKGTAVPIISVQDSQGEFEGAMGRGVDQGFRYRLRLFAATADNMDPGSDICDLVFKPDGPTSLRAAVSADRTLGGACQTLKAEAYQSHVIYDLAGQLYLGGELVVVIY